VTIAVLLPVLALLSIPAATLFQTGKRDSEDWTDALAKVDFPAGMRHGSFVQITQAEFDRFAALMMPATTATTDKADPQ
jgi:hypothetical protein